MLLHTFSLSDMEYLASAGRATLSLSLLTFVGSGLLGLLLTFLRVSRNPVARLFALGYIELIQSIPLLTQLFIWFFLLSLYGIRLQATLAAGIALTVNATAFFAEIWRGSIEAVPRTQWEAAASIGMSRRQQITYIIAPQALRIAIPPTIGLMIQIIKGTSLTALVGFVELTRAGQLVTSTTFQPLTTFSTVALLYLAICLPLSLISQRLEDRLDVGDSIAVGV